MKYEKKAKKVKKPATAKTSVAKTTPKLEEQPVVPVEIELPDARPDRRIQWMGGFFAGLLLFGGTAALAYQRTVSGFETHLFRYINNWPDSLRPLFLVCTIVPESLWIAVAAVLVTFFLKLYRLSWQLAVATIGGYGAAYLAKHFIGRARPLELIHGAQVRINETGMGFPSGHTMIITVVVLTLFPYLPRGWRWVIVALLPLMALSRIYLGVHLPLDVVGGFAVGLATVSFLRVLPKKLREKLRFD